MNSPDPRDELLNLARALLVDLLSHPSEDVQSPGRGALVSLQVYPTTEDMLHGENEVGWSSWSWGESGPDRELDAGEFDPHHLGSQENPIREQFFYHVCDMAPMDPDDPEHGGWMLEHAFGGIHRGRKMFNGLKHWIRRGESGVEVTDTDIWFS
jgi:hypothetical protein